MSKNTYLRNLNQQELRILMEIQEHPLVTYEELAQISGFPKTQVYRIVKKLEDSSLKPPYFKIVTVPDLQNLGLIQLEVLVEAETIDELDKCKQLCEEHPYIWYYSKCFGKINGMFIQFRLPYGKNDKINDLFNLMKARGWIRNFEMIHFNTESIITKPEVKNWNFDTLSWNFNWKDWLKLDIPQKINSKTIKKNSFEDIRDWLQKRDIAILAELLRNVRRKNNTMIQFLKDRGFDLTPQLFSRRIKNIRNYLVKDYRAEIHSETFDLLFSILIFGYGDKLKLEEIRKRIISKPIPYYSTVKIDDYKIFWYLHISLVNLSDLLEYFRPLLHNLQFFYIDFPKSKTFLPDYTTYDEEKKEWVQNDDFLIYDVLKKLET